MLYKSHAHPLTALAAALLLGTGAAAHAQVIVGNAPVALVSYGEFMPQFGNDGYILFDTLPQGSSQIGYEPLTDIITQTPTGLANVIVKPSYISSLNGLPPSLPPWEQTTPPITGIITRRLLGA